MVYQLTRILTPPSSPQSSIPRFVLPTEKVLSPQQITQLSTTTSTHIYCSGLSISDTSLASPAFYLATTLAYTIRFVKINTCYGSTVCCAAVLLFIRLSLTQESKNSSTLETSNPHPLILVQYSSGHRALSVTFGFLLFHMLPGSPGPRYITYRVERHCYRRLHQHVGIFRYSQG
jgi:hypothetical protein